MSVYQKMLEVASNVSKQPNVLWFHPPKSEHMFLISQETEDLCVTVLSAWRDEEGNDQSVIDLLR